MERLSNAQICFLGLSIGPPWSAGLPNYFLRLVKGLREADINSILITTENPYTKSLEFPLYRKVQLPPVLSTNKTAKYIKLFFTMIRVFAVLIKTRDSYDIIYSLYPKTLFFSFWLKFYRRILKKKTILLVDGPVKRKNAEYTSKKVYNVLNWGGDLILITSLDEERKIKQSFPSLIPKVRYVPLGVPIEEFRHKFKQDFKKEHFFSSKFIILYAGHLWPEKGVEVLLHAANLLKDRIPNLEIVIAGSGGSDHSKNERSLISKTRELEIEKIVRFLGYRKDIFDIMIAADIIVIPLISNFGTLSPPLTVLDGMASGTPVIATGVGSIPFVIKNGETGLIFPPSDPFTLSEKIVNLWTNSEMRQQIGEKAMEYVKKNNSWQNVAEETLQCLLELVSDIEKKTIISTTRF